MPMMQLAVAGSNFKKQNLSKRFAEVKTLKKIACVSHRHEDCPRIGYDAQSRSPIAQIFQTVLHLIWRKTAADPNQPTQLFSQAERLLSH
jgi:hypothetical protein